MTKEVTWCGYFHKLSKKILSVNFSTKFSLKFIFFSKKYSIDLNNEDNSDEKDQDNYDVSVIEKECNNISNEINQFQPPLNIELENETEEEAQEELYLDFRNRFGTIDELDFFYNYDLNFDKPIENLEINLGSGELFVIIVPITS